MKQHSLIHLELPSQRDALLLLFPCELWVSYGNPPLLQARTQGGIRVRKRKHHILWFAIARDLVIVGTGGDGLKTIVSDARWLDRAAQVSE